MGGGGGELGEIGDDARPNLVEIIDAGHADIAHVAEEGAFVADQVFAAPEVDHQLFMIQVDHVFHVARLAPVFLGLVEIVAEHAAPHVPVVGLGALRLGRHRAGEELGDVGFEVVAFFLLKGFEQLGRPGHEAGVVGLVAAEAEDGFAELVADELSRRFRE